MGNAKIKITMNRTSGSFDIDSAVSTRIYARDSAIDVEVAGFTSGEAAKNPYFRLLDRGKVIAECALSQGSGTSMTGTLSTNTKQVVDMFMGCHASSSRTVTVEVFATTVPKPFSIGEISIYNFPIEGGSAPAELPTASSVIQNITNVLLAHVNNVTGNPHAVTPQLIGALSEAQAAIEYAKKTALSALEATVNANTASLQTCVSQINLINMILAQKVNSSDTYTRAELNGILKWMPKPLHGISFGINKAGDIWDAVEFIIKVLGGTIGGNTIPAAGNAPISSVIIGDDGQAHSLIAVTDSTGAKIPYVEQ